MRYVDIDELLLPAGWQNRADDALNGLRQEIVQAEDDALATGEDVAAARKRAIALGLQDPKREVLWRDLKDALSALTYGKCWYSESRNPTADKEVDHFRPKNRVT